MLYGIRSTATVGHIPTFLPSTLFSKKNEKNACGNFKEFDAFYTYILYIYDIK